MFLYIISFFSCYSMVSLVILNYSSIFLRQQKIQQQQLKQTYILLLFFQLNSFQVGHWLTYQFHLEAALFMFLWLKSDYKMINYGGLGSHLKVHLGELMKWQHPWVQFY